MRPYLYHPSLPRNPSFLLILALSVFTRTDAATPKTSPLKLHLETALGGRSVEDQRLSAQAFGLQLNTDFSYRFHPNLRSSVRISGQFEEGRQKSFFDSNYGPQNELRLHHGALEFSPARWVQLEAGVLDQSHWDQPLLISNSGFLGVGEIIRWKLNRQFQFQLRAQQTLARDDTIVRTGSNEEQNLGSPAYFHESFGIQWTPDPAQIVSISIYHFQFANLSTGAAQKSRFLGNTVTGLGPSNARFNEEYGGLGTRGEINTPIPLLEKQLSFGMSGNYFQNGSAPSGKNAAFLLKTSVTTQFLPAVELQPEFLFFRNEADSSPALYSSRHLGYKNRQGFGIGMTATLKSLPAYIQGRWVQAKRLLPNPYQGDFQGLSILFGGTYELL